MNYSNLEELINAVEFGTKIHICIVFLDDYGNIKTDLSPVKCIHSMPICDFCKSTDEGYSKCVRCRNTVLKRIKRQKKELSGICPNGIYECCRPVVIKGDTVCVIFIGNIYPENDNRLLAKITNRDYLETLEKNIDAENCKKIANIIEGHIRVLLEKYATNKNNAYNPLAENIKKYIEENLTCDFSVAEISEIFNYNEKYLGRIFKREFGMSIKKYVNSRRVEMAEELLKTVNLPIIEISSKVGFNNVTYFNKIFKCITGAAPQEFRKKTQPKV